VREERRGEERRNERDRTEERIQPFFSKYMWERIATTAWGERRF
jgi:hypothetical protein